MAAPDKDLLVITPDGSSAALVRQVFGGKLAVFACHEDFTFGPLKAGLSPEALLRLRHRHRVRQIGHSFRAPGRDSLRQMAPRYKAIEIWLGGSGREQLFLAGVIHAQRSFGIEPQRIAVRQFPAG